MPAAPGAFICTPSGTRRLLPEEVYRGLGGSDKQRLPPSLSLLSHSSSVFIFEALTQSILGLTQGPTPLTLTSPLAPPAALASGATPPPVAPEPFHWQPPDLSEGGPWFEERLRSLRAAAATYPDPALIEQEGLEMLRIHRGNYDRDGPAPTELRILWWEFQQEHWEPLRVGSRMNFLATPCRELTPNANMDAEQLEIGSEFVEELLSLGVLRKYPVSANGPMFVVPKEGQPGQWRVISDMLRGGQNVCIGSDPVYLPRVSHIVQELYEDGWSAVVDASKFFWQFRTHPDDREFLGCIHPLTKELYAYFGLPMGSASSPCLGGRYGLAFLRRLRARFMLFQGKPAVNCYWTKLSGGTFSPRKGYGLIWEGEDGLVVRLWVFVDDFLIHAPTQALCAEALRFFLDASVECGMLCNPKKIIPPSQRVRYCGFELDTVGIPTLCIPVAKRERALAMVTYVRSAPTTKRFSRLGLAVVAGVLESLVDATPRRYGHTKLRGLHSLIHPAGLSGVEPYYSYCELPTDVCDDIEWWETFLRFEGGTVVRMTDSGTLVPTWGDGSGTGTGGTYTLPDRPLRMWKGKWSPFVYSFSSNWKELNTLRLTLHRLLADAPESVRGTTVFYFTDNSTTYWICCSGSSKWPRLHSLITAIRLLEFQLGCQLVVVHVPGYIMISQGTDSLSRGVWMSPYHDLRDQTQLLSGLFAPLPYDPSLIEEVLHLLPSTGKPSPGVQWEHRNWAFEWDAATVLDRFTVWFPPPELARQVLVYLLEAYCERPLTTSALLFIPRIRQDTWQGLSRHICEVCTILPHVTPLRRPPLVPIPVVVLYLPPHVRALPSSRRMDSVRPSHWERRHLDEAALMRRLPGEPLGERPRP